MPITTPTIEDHESWEDALPKRAQAKLALLRQLLAEERKTSAALRGDIEQTDTLLKHHGIHPDQPLPQGSEVSFVPDLTYPHREIACKLRDGFLEVHGERSLRVLPRASNYLLIALEK